MREMKKPNKYAPANVRTTFKKGTYDGKELLPPASIEPSRLKAFTLPSRWGNTLIYPCGRTEVIDHGRNSID